MSKRSASVPPQETEASFREQLEEEGAKTCSPFAAAARSEKAAPLRPNFIVKICVVCVEGPAVDMNCTNFEVSEFRNPFFVVIYSILFIVGLPGNLAAFYYFVHNKAKKRLTEVKIYMISLALADLLFIVFLPFWIDYYSHGGHWRFSDFLCSFCGSLFFINTYNTLFFLSLISFTRYLAVSRPVKVAQSKQIQRGGVITVIIWIGTVSPSLKVLVNNKSHIIEINNSKRCFENYFDRDVKTQLLVIHSLMLLGFVLTLGAVIANSVLILRRLSVDRTVLGLHQSKLKKRAFRMVLRVLVVYLVCFLPYHLIQLPWVMLVLDVWESSDCVLRKAFNDAHQVTLGLMTINCALDPIVYCFLTKDFKQHLRDLTRYYMGNCTLKSSSKSQTIQHIIGVK
ncbi:platelet-activating factor receptor-like [Narcine bancroftii]|uniref:platelet-activating factor receptor-like n=1 Tax=Narcine bancroftii TaxID=1343680 RepID=UPI0038312CA0